MTRSPGRCGHRSHADSDTMPEQRVLDSGEIADREEGTGRTLRQDGIIGDSSLDGSPTGRGRGWRVSRRRGSTRARDNDRSALSAKAALNGPQLFWDRAEGRQETPPPAIDVRHPSGSDPPRVLTIAACPEIRLQKAEIAPPGGQPWTTNRVIDAVSGGDHARPQPVLSVRLIARNVPRTLQVRDRAASSAASSTRSRSAAAQRWRRRRMGTYPQNNLRGRRGRRHRHRVRRRRVSGPGLVPCYRENAATSCTAANALCARVPALGDGRRARMATRIPAASSSCPLHPDRHADAAARPASPGRSRAQKSPKVARRTSATARRAKATSTRQ